MHDAARLGTQPGGPPMRRVTRITTVAGAVLATAVVASSVVGTHLSDDDLRPLAVTFFNGSKNIHYLDSTVCFCSTMNRIDLPHLVWALESLAGGDVVNRITVEPLAIPDCETMLTGPGA